jgi:hypothetical protein
MEPYLVGYSISFKSGLAIGVVFETEEAALKTAERLELKDYSINDEWYPHKPEDADV